MFRTRKSAGRPGPGQPGGPLQVTSWLGGEPDAELLREMLREVIDPEIGINIVDLGLVYDVRLADGVVTVRMTLTTPGCPLGGYLEDAIGQCLWGAPGVSEVTVQIVWEPAWDPGAMMSERARQQLGWTR